MISTVIDICKNIIDFIRQSDEVEKDNIERISDILNNISNVLNDTAEKLLNDVYPHDNCVVMQRLSKDLHSNLLGYLPKEDIDILYNSLMESSMVEKEFALRKEPDTIPSIERAAGEFKAMSILIKLRNT
jgi:hypothetical protein